MHGQLHNELISHINIQRLQEIIQRAVAQRFLSIFKFRISAYDDKLSVQPMCLGPLHQIQPGNVRHTDICKYQIWFIRSYGIPGIVSAFKLTDDFKPILIPIKGVADSFNCPRFIIYNHDLIHGYPPEYMESPNNSKTIME
ncbi:hypothetical protein D3C73_1121680 [compost metagenome]